MKRYIGADLGTSALKLLLVDETGAIEKKVTRSYGVSYPAPGWSEQSPEDWWEALRLGLRELLSETDPETLCGIGVGGQMHGLVVLDDGDRVIRPAILWNDGRTAKQTEALNRDVSRLADATANMAFAGFTAPKILWMKEREPENFAKISKLMLPKDYLNYRLTGRACTDFSDASGLLLLDVAQKKWSSVMLEICGIREEQLPKLCESCDVVGTVLPAVAAELGIPELPVVAGAGDNAAAAVGTGTLNDIGKIIANLCNKPYMIVGTAPSMDGFSSATSSMIRDGLKISLNSKCPEIVIGDLDILSKAPLRMIRAGIGDMAAKYVSIGEWQLSRIINGEYYCPEIAALVSAALKKCADNAAGIMTRDPEAVRAVMEGMVLAGIAANYAGISYPVSGIEHYISHIWDMRALEFDSPCDLHGIQCGVSTLLALKVFDYARTVVPDREKALAAAKRFNYDEYRQTLVAALGKSADSMIANEAREGKYDPEKHAARLEVILSRYDEISAVINNMPSYDTVCATLNAAGFPLTPAELGFSPKEVHDAFVFSKDIRDKYIISRLLWDLGLLDEAANTLFPY